MGERGLSVSLDAGDDTDASVALNASHIAAASGRGEGSQVPEAKSTLPFTKSIFNAQFRFRQKSAFSTLANYFRSLLVIEHGDEGAMPQMPGICPFDKCDLAH